MRFYGRQDIIDILNKRANSLGEGYRQNIIILGEEFIGKTYLLQHWLATYCNNYILPLYLEIKITEENIFTQKFIGTLLYAFLRNSQSSLKDELEFLIEKSRNYLPHTIKSAKEILSEHKKTPTTANFTRLLELLEIFYKETGKRPCIILDEFHRLEDFLTHEGKKTKDFYAQWRKHIMLGKNTMYVLVSSKISFAEKIINNDLNLLFGNFEKIEFTGLAHNTASGFTCSKLSSLNIANNTLLDFIIDFSSSKPFYLDIFSNAFLEYHKLNPNTQPSIDTLAESLENIFLGDWGILNKRFQDLLSSQSLKTAPGILNAISIGAKKTSEIAHNVKVPKKEILPVLARLEAEGVISRNEDICLINDRLFAFWLKYVYQARINSFDTDFDKQRNAFRANIISLFDNFDTSQKKALSERILELFNLFTEQDLQIEKKHLRLNHFKEVKLLNIAGKKLKEGVLGRAQKSLWIAGMKEGYTSEEDLIEFINLCKKFEKSGSFQKKIFIVFDEMDVNAKLIAKEKKVITWNVDCLNSLLEIYGQPRIVRQPSSVEHIL